MTAFLALVNVMPAMTSAAPTAVCQPSGSPRKAKPKKVDHSGNVALCQAVRRTLVTPCISRGAACGSLKVPVLSVPVARLDSGASRSRRWK
nr:hypothetical protein [Lentzea tibetensis]